MTCTQTQMLLPGYMDGELDLVHSLAIEQHMQTCGECTQLYHQQQALHAGLQARELYYAPPAGLEKRLQRAIRQAAEPARSAPRGWPGKTFSLAVAFGLVLLVSAGLLWGRLAPGTGDPLAQAVVAGHVRSLMPGHLTDVTSSDQHTVKPWFDGKLPFAPPVTDLAAQGFPLLGGRLDYLDNQPVAALVYGRAKHTINLFFWPAAGAPTSSLQLTTRQGYNLVHWTRGEMQAWAVSDLNSTELEQFARLIQQTQGGPAAPP
jgi:anti-sigma factor RsiW